MQIRIYSKLSPGLYRRVRQFELDHFYGEGEKTPERFTKQEEKYFSQPKAWLLVFGNGRIIGRALLHKREIEFAGEKIILGGFGGVCTAKNERRKGIASTMLKEGMRILKKWNCDIAYLCADVEKVGPLYSHIGFVPLNKLCVYKGKSGKVYEDEYGLIAPVNSRRLFKEVLNSKEKFNLGLGNW